MTTIKVFEVGGAVRDELLGVPTKDVDFAVEAPSFDAMLSFVKDRGFRVFDVNERFLTVRAGVPKGDPLRERTNAADFVLCRKDSATGDGRRPDFVEPGTIMDDLARRDFTVNAMARDTETGELLDPFGGQADLRERRLQFVGTAQLRIREDGLRVMRALRFAVTKGLTMTDDTVGRLLCQESAAMLAGVSVERVRDELDKMVRADTPGTLALLARFPNLMPAIFRDGLRFEATLKKA